ncbi:MAG: SET domain-containing protein-lysine N-methyltransferase [Patescibacteria group bacterium]
MRKDVEIKQASKKGRGVFALRNFRQGDIVFTNVRGKLIKEKDLESVDESEGDHLNEIDKKTWEIMNPPGRFVNHSCDPNVISKESSKKKVPYIALKAIKKGDEITVDYRINAHTGDSWKCYCGSKNCVGEVISDFFSLDKKLQKKYLSYSAKYIQAEYKKRQESLR